MNWWARITAREGQYSWAVGVIGRRLLGGTAATLAEARQRVEQAKKAYGVQPGTPAAAPQRKAEP